MKAMRMPLAVAITAIIVNVALATSALSATQSCVAGINKEVGRFTQSRLKALERCEEWKVQNRLSSSIDCLVWAKNSIGTAKLRMERNIRGKCCGPDHDCATGTDNDPLASIGWGTATCPGFEDDCHNAISDGNDVIGCLSCATEKATSQAVELYYGAVNYGKLGTAERCQITIGKEAARYALYKSKTLVRCWTQRVAGVHQNDCYLPQDGAADKPISAARERMVQKLARACCGPNGVCDGADGDLAPSEIGFAANCSDVVRYNGQVCSGPVTNMLELIACVQCATDYKVECTDMMSIPAYRPYPDACKHFASESSTTTTTSITTTTTTSTTTTSSTSTSTTTLSTTTTMATTTSSTSSTVSSSTTTVPTTTTTVSTSTTTSTSTSTTHTTTSTTTTSTTTTSTTSSSTTTSSTTTTAPTTSTTSTTTTVTTTSSTTTTTLIDSDGDGTPDVQDCAPNNPAIHPGAIEVCNSTDDNCNGVNNEGDPGGGGNCAVPGKLGRCAQGILHCIGTGLVCTQQYAPVIEVCGNQIDDDCDGSVDESPCNNP